jgi:hypothetical protein
LFDLDFHHLKGDDEEWTNIYTVDAYHTGNVSQKFPSCELFANFPLAVYEILGMPIILLLILASFWKSPRITRVTQIAGFIPATSMKGTLKSHSLLSSPSGISSPIRRSALTIKEHTLERMKMKMNHHQKRTVMNQRTKSIQDVFAERKIVEVKVQFIASCDNP